ncbi:LOW QUALITY PROTEIN: cell cycle checkpoint protein RAD17 [Chironomus tepperi]|uniref:LOW QUALITY PROTEIN: cell cycle checkpoint protein RAD17 n=1 Tax=Chironomus tepperi TaxID=113505 RepID=UPI00391F8D59
MSKGRKWTVSTRRKDEEVVEAKKSKSNEHINWLKFLEPKTVDDLIVHPKKIEDIKKWFMLGQQLGKSNRILLLIGPSGSSKLSAMKVISKEFDFNVCEWTAKSEVDRDLLIDEGERGFYYKKQSELFQEFLIKVSRYNSIFSQKERILIVKDFPNIFMRKGNEEEFWSILKKYKTGGTNPLVFILTDTNSKSLNIEYNLFPDKIRAQIGIDTINMNPISATLMKKALKQICAKMKEHEHTDSKFKEPTQSVIDDIIAQSQGDIRNAIMNLQLVSQQGSIDLSMQTKSRAKKTGKAKKTPTDKINKGVGRDEVLGIFHGVGRALHPKKEEDPQTKENEAHHNPDSVAECFSSQPGNYIELLHSNYLKTFSSIDDVKDFTRIMSASDIFQTEYRSAEKLHDLNLNLVIRGAMVCNTEPSKGFRPITGYANKKFRSVEEKCLQEYLCQSTEFNDGHRMSLKDYFLDYTGFLTLFKSYGDNSSSL